MKQLGNMVNGVITVIDDALKNLEAFEDSKRRSEYILEMVEQAVATTDDNGIILSVNCFFEQKTGWTFADIEKKKIYDLIPRHHYKELKRLLTFSQEGIFLNEEKFNFNLKNGDEKEFDLSICRMVRSDGCQRYIFLLK